MFIHARKLCVASMFVFITNELEIETSFDSSRAMSDEEFRALNNTGRILIAVALILGGLLVSALLVGPENLSALNSAGGLTIIALNLGYLFLVSGALYAGIRREGRGVLRYVAVWLIIALLLALVYRMMN